MPKSIKFVQQDHDLETRRVLEAEFEDAEWSAIERFGECAQRIAENGITNDAYPLGTTLHWEDGVMSTEVKLPPVEAQESFLLRMRMVILQNEPTYFGKIANHLCRRIDDANFRKAIAVLKRQFAGAHITSMIGVRAISNSNESLEITSEKALDVWLNGELYHGDADKRELLRRVHGLMPLDSSRVLFLFLLRDKALASVNLANAIRVFEGKQESFSFSTGKQTPPTAGTGT